MLHKDRYQSVIKGASFRKNKFRWEIANKDMSRANSSNNAISYKKKGDIEESQKLNWFNTIFNYSYGLLKV